MLEANRVRLSKYISATHGVSRNEAERLIEAGKVMLNGSVVRSPSFIIDIDSAKVTLTGVAPTKKNFEAVTDKDIKLYMLHKPRGIVVTRSDEKGRPTVYSFVHKDLIYIGRLDFNSEGLLLFTNSGAFSRHLELPKNKVTREYRVRVLGDVTEKKLERMRKGVTIEGISYIPVSIEVEKRKTDSSANVWLNVVLTSGKNREIRKLMDFFNLTVNRLIRVAYGNITLGSLPIGQVLEVPHHKVAKLKKISGYEELS